MTRPAASPRGRASLTARASAWLRAHRTEAAIGGAGGAGVIALALMRRHSATANTADTSGTAASTTPVAGLTPSGSYDGTGGSAGDGSSGQPLGDYIAGLDSDLTQQLGGLGTQLGGIQDTLTSLGEPHPPAAPTPTPKRTFLKGSKLTKGAQTYAIRPGDTVADIARKVYGTQAAWAINEIKKHNPILASFGDKASLSHYHGHLVDVAPAKLPVPKKHPAPKPAPKHKPAPRRAAPKPAPRRKAAPKRKKK